MQSGELVQYADRPPPRVGGRDFAGPSVLDRFYPAAEGQVRVVATSLDQFVAAGLLPSAQLTDEDTVDAISRGLQALSRAKAVTLLEKHGIVAVPARNISELSGNADVRDAYLTTVKGNTGADFYVPHRLARFARTERSDVLQTSGAGEHTSALLEEAGLDAEEIERAIASGAVGQGQPLSGIGAVSYR